MPVQHVDNTGGRGPSPAIFDWANTGLPFDLNEGVRFQVDFTSLNGTVTSNVGTYATDGGGLKTAEASGATTKLISTINSVVTAGGVMEATAATDNDDDIGEFGDGNGGMVVPTVGVGNGRIGFEARVLIDVTTANITTFAADYFIGLSTPGQGSTAGGIFTTADALTTANNMIGMWILTGAPTTLKCGWRNATGLTTKGTLQAGITGFTWYKIGFLFSPNGTHNLGSSDAIQFFVNGAEVLSMRTTTATIDANFPTGLALVPSFGVMPNGSHSNKLDIDWIRCWAEAQPNG